MLRRWRGWVSGSGVITSTVVRVHTRRGGRRRYSAIPVWETVMATTTAPDLWRMGRSQSMRFTSRSFPITISTKRSRVTQRV